MKFSQISPKYQVQLTVKMHNTLLCSKTYDIYVNQLTFGLNFISFIIIDLDLHYQSPM